MRKRGFTLLELLVVISIIGLLSSIVMSSVNSARLKAKQAAALEFYRHNTTALFDDAILLYTLDEGIGTVVNDGSASGNTGTVKLGSNGPTWVQGKFGNALLFDGRTSVPAQTDDMLDFTDYIPDQDSFTLSAWFYLSTTGLDPAIIYPIFGNYQGTPMLGYRTSDKSFYHLRQWVGSSETIGWNVSGMPSFADNTWHHILLSVDQTKSPRTAELYVDGVSVGKKNLSGTEGYGHGNGSVARMGADYDKVWNGMIDEIGVYKRALTK